MSQWHFGQTLFEGCPHETDSLFWYSEQQETSEIVARSLIWILQIGYLST